MSDIVLDTNALADFLAQYFGTALRGQSQFIVQDTISVELARQINQIARRHRRKSAEENVERYQGLVVASTFAFVEIARKWTTIVNDRFTIEEMAGFIEQPPEWFVIDPVDESLVEAFSNLPTDVLTAPGKTKSVEWTDAVHIATTLSRGDQCLLATTDRRIRQVEVLRGRVI